MSSELSLPSAPSDVAQHVYMTYARLLSGLGRDGKLDVLLKDYSSKGLPPPSDKVRSYRGMPGVVVLAQGSLDEPGKYMTVRSVIRFGQNYVMLGFVRSPDDLRALTKLDEVIYILADKVIRPEKLDIDAILSRGGGYVLPNLWRVREIIGVNNVETDFGVTGEGAVISIVDTGVDFGVLDLRDAMDRDSNGFPNVFDPSGTGIVLTNYTFEKDPSGILRISGHDFLVWSMGMFYTYSQLRELYPGLPELRDLYVGDAVVSRSGVYHVGVLFEYGAALSLKPTLACFLCVVVDSHEAGVYDTVYVDLDWDFSLADEEPHRWGDPVEASEVLAKDVNEDGWPDISAGCLCRVFDFFNIANGGIIEGIDPSGNWIGVMYDYFGHGTPCAACAVGRGTLGFDVYKNGTYHTLPGVARGAKVQAVKMITISDVLMSWMWSCGFDLSEDGTWVYTGEHKADIISNSWGLSEFEQLGSFAMGWDMLSLTIDALSTPGFMDPSYPGTLFLVAGGNGGPGYGTVTAPSVSTSAICVGATTSYHAFEPFYGPNQGYDEVVYWSARGPSPLGAPEPDVLNVGWLAFSPYPVWAGQGDGRQAFGVFAGTSMATPLTAGVCALVISALRSRGLEPDPSTVKYLLESTADELGYDPLTQGAGRVNAYRAVAAALGMDTAGGLPIILTYSTATSSNVGMLVNDAFHFWFGEDHPALTSPILDAGIFMGRVAPGGSLMCSLRAGTPSGAQIDAISATTFVLVRRAVVELPKTTGTYNTYVLAELLDEEFMDEFLSCDMAMIFLSYDASLFRRLALAAQNPSYVFLHDWVDLDLDGEIDYNGSGEVRRIADCFRWSNVLSMYVGRPGLDFHRYNPEGPERGPTIMFHDTGFEEFGDWHGTELLLTVLLFREVPWAWVSVERDPTDGTLWHITVDVPEDARPSVHAGFLLLRKGTMTTKVPITVSVVGSSPRGPSSLRLGNSTGQPYDLGALYGAFDWSWREESGDYRIFTFDVSDPSAKYAVFGVSWPQELTMVDAWVVGPNGQVLVKSPIRHVGGGRFESKSTRDKGQVLVVEFQEPGTYTFVLHATAFDGSFNPENITVFSYYSTMELPEAVATWSATNGSVLYGPHARVSVSWSLEPVEELPDVAIWKTQLSIMKGIFLRLKGTIDPAEDRLKSGWYERVGECEDYIYVWLKKGSSVYVEVGWVGPLTDIDVFCWPPGVEQTFDNSLLGDQTATLNNPERGKFKAPVTGNYTIGIDWYGGPANELPVPYYVIVSTLRGHTISRSGGAASIDTSIMGVNGTFLLNSTLLTGTNIQYKTNITITAYNFFPPRVKIIYPRPGDVVNGTVLIRWEAHDPNEPDERLTFDLYVSFDGGNTWKVLAYNLWERSYEWDTRPFARCGVEYCNTTMLKVVVSDGKVEREDISGPFTVDNRPPLSLPEKPPQKPLAWRPGDMIAMGVGVTIAASVGVATYVMLKRRRKGVAKGATSVSPGRGP